MAKVSPAAKGTAQTQPIDRVRGEFSKKVEGYKRSLFEKLRVLRTQNIVLGKTLHQIRGNGVHYPEVTLVAEILVLVDRLLGLLPPDNALVGKPLPPEPEVDVKPPSLIKHDSDNYIPTDAPWKRQGYLPKPIKEIRLSSNACPFCGPQNKIFPYNMSDLPDFVMRYGSVLMHNGARIKFQYLAAGDSVFVFRDPLSGVVGATRLPYIRESEMNDIQAILSDHTLRWAKRVPINISPEKEEGLHDFNRIFLDQVRPWGRFDPYAFLIGMTLFDFMKYATDLRRLKTGALFVSGYGDIVPPADQARFYGALKLLGLEVSNVVEVEPRGYFSENNVSGRNVLTWQELDHEGEPLELYSDKGKLKRRKRLIMDLSGGNSSNKFDYRETAAARRRGAIYEDSAAAAANAARTPASGVMGRPSLIGL